MHDLMRILHVVQGVCERECLIFSLAPLPVSVGVSACKCSRRWTLVLEECHGVFPISALELSLLLFSLMRDRVTCNLQQRLRPCCMPPSGSRGGEKEAGFACGIASLSRMKGQSQF